MTALLDVVAGAYAWTTPPTRRLKLWSDVPTKQRPVAFLFEGGNESHVWTNGAVPKRTIEAKIFIYINAKDPISIGSSQINDIMDALDAAMALTGADQMTGRNTLGGTAYWCRIDGTTLKDPGDLDGDGMVVVPIKINLP